MYLHAVIEWLLLFIYDHVRQICDPFCKAIKDRRGAVLQCSQQRHVARKVVSIQPETLHLIFTYSTEQTAGCHGLGLRPQPQRHC